MWESVFDVMLAISIDDLHAPLANVPSNRAYLDLFQGTQYSICSFRAAAAAKGETFAGSMLTRAEVCFRISKMSL